MATRSLEYIAGSCLWLAAKADGSRANLPSRSLMAAGVGVDGLVLAETELVRCFNPSYHPPPSLPSPDSNPAQ